MLSSSSLNLDFRTTGSLRHLNPDVMDLTIECRTFNHENPQGKSDNINVVRLNTHYKFHGIWVNPSYTVSFAEDDNYLVFMAVLRDVVTAFKFFDKKVMRLLCISHGIEHRQMSKPQLSVAMIRHQCTSRCSVYVYVFKCLPASTRRLNVMDKLAVSDMPLDLVNSLEFLQGPSTHALPELLHNQPSNSFSVAAVSPEDNRTLASETAHLDLAGEQFKLDIIREWQEALSTDKLALVVCAACSARTPTSDSKWVHAGDIELELLRNVDLPAALLPREYDLSVYRFALLDAKGLEYRDRLGHMRLCRRCFKSLSMSAMPKFALSNWLYYARDIMPEHVKQAFKNSSIFERMLICRARSNSVTCRFNSKDIDDNDPHSNVDFRGPGNRVSESNILRRARRGVRGNVLVTPLDSLRMNAVIPPPATAIRDTMTTIFVGKDRPNLSNIKKYSPVLVRRARVKTMIQFLMDVNPYYRESDSFKYSQTNMDSLAEGDVSEDQVLSAVYIGHVAMNDALQTATSDYTTRNIAEWSGNEEDEELLMENVGYTDGDFSPLAYQQMKNVALERCLAGKPFLGSGTGSDIVPDFHNPAILTWLFPHLDPWGIGGFHHPNRRQTISMDEQLRHLLMIDDDAFESDPEFAFVFYNVCRKSLVSHSLRFSVPARTHTRIVDDLLALEPEVIARLNSACEKDPYYRPVDATEKEVFRCLSAVRMVSKHVPGSDGYKIALRNEIRALMNHKGAPTMFITLNPSDVDNPIVRLLAGDEIDLEDVTRGDEMNRWKRSLFAAKNPSACARFFDLMITNFINIILRYGQARPGLYGKCTSYYGTVEAQGKGTLHCHMLIWLEGHLPPDRLRSAVISSEDYRAKFLKWLESVIQCEFPGSTGIESQKRSHPRRKNHEENGDPHPGVIAPPLVSAYENPEEFWADYTRFVETLLHHYAWHVHTATCWKYLDPGQEKTDKNCRVGMNGDTYENSGLDIDTSDIILRRHHPMIAAHTDVVTFLMRCNMDIKYVGTGDAANAFVYYVTDYITKASLSVHIGMASLIYAIGKLKDGSPDLNRKDRMTESRSAVRTVTTAVNSMMGKQEISHPQVMSYIVGGGDHYKSDEFAVLSWGSIRLMCPLNIHTSVTSPESSEHHETNQFITLLLEHKNVNLSSQYLDYVFRSADPVFDALCLYDFAATTSKRRFPEPRIDSSYRAGAFVDSQHPQYLTHRLVRSRVYRIPVLLGPRIPNPSRSEEYREEWSRDMILLFKPWRDTNSLKPLDCTWTRAYEELEPFWSKEHREIIANMVVAAECADARDRHRERRRGMSTDDIVAEYSEEDAQRVVDGNHGDQHHNHWQLDDEHSQWDPFGVTMEPTDVNQYEADDTLDRESYFLLDHCFPCDLTNGMSNVPALWAERVEEDDKATLSSQRAVMATKKRKRGVSVDDVDSDDHDVDDRSQRIRRNTDPLSEWLVLGEDRRFLFTLNKYSIASEVIRDMHLDQNREQLKAFRIIAGHIIEGKKDQLMMYVSGVGGTGKSHLIRAIVVLFERLKIREHLILGAPTGIAAVLINGRTLHSLILASPQGTSQDMSALTGIWKFCWLLIIDEISMVGAQFLAQFSAQVRLGRGDHIVDRDKPFGGVNVLFTGDFGQLSPPKQRALYANCLVNDPSFPEARDNGGVQALNGAFIWRQVTKVVELVKNQRQAGDPEYSAFLNRLRIRECIVRVPRNGVLYSDLDYLYDRIITNVDKATLKEFSDAPIIVGSKKLRDLLNAKLVRYHAKRLESELHTYYSRDTVSKSPVEGVFQHQLWRIPSSENKEAFGKLPLFIGMKVMVTENLAFGHGIVNGSEGFITGIKYDEDIFNRRYVQVVYVKIVGCALRVDGLEEDIVPIFPIKTRLRHNIENAQSRYFTREQVPLVPAYVYTDFKAQGRTTDRVIADLVTAKGQGAYVMLSRVKSLAGLLILRWFPPNRIYQRLSEELRAEFERLGNLSLATEDDASCAWAACESVLSSSDVHENSL